MTNEEVLRRIQSKRRQPQEIIQLKRGLFGRVCRMKDDRVIKTVILGMCDGSERRGWPKRQWLDDIKGWTDISIAQLVRLAEDRKAWRDLTKCTVGTNGPDLSHGDSVKQVKLVSCTVLSKMGISV